MRIRIRLSDGFSLIVLNKDVDTISEQLVKIMQMQGYVELYDIVTKKNKIINPAQITSIEGI